MGFCCPELHNPGDYLMSIMHHESEKNLQNYTTYFKNYEEKLMLIVSEEMNKKNIGNIESIRDNVNIYIKMCTLLRRDVINILRNPILLKTRLFAVIIVSLFLGGLYYNVADIYNDTLNPVGLRISGFYSIAGAMFNLTINSFLEAFNPVSLTFPI